MNIEKNNPEVLLERVRLMMQYDSTVTYKENIMILESELLNEDFEFWKKIKQKFKSLYNWFASFNNHDWLTLVEISTAVLGMIPTPAAPLFLGISTLAGVTDAVTYYNEGDKYMGTMMLALSIIPGGELMKGLKGTKVIGRRGIKGTKDLIKKYKSGAKLTAEETKDLVSLGKIMSKESSTISKLMKKNLGKNFIKSLKDKTPKYIMNLLMILKKIGVFKLSELVFKVGGTAWTADKLYLFVFRDVLESKKDLDSRTKNDLRAMVNGLLGYEEQVKEYMIAKATESLEKALEGGKVDLISINPTETPEEAAMKWALESQKTNTNEPQTINYVTSPSIDSVKNGSDVIELGDKGESVKEIQKMLYDMGYEDYITDFQTITDWNNGEFDEAMKFSVEIFQEDNKLKSDGIIDKITINKMMDIYSNIDMYARQ
jgi:hypothetical protein